MKRTYPYVVCALLASACEDYESPSGEDELTADSEDAGETEDDLPGDVQAVDPMDPVFDPDDAQFLDPTGVQAVASTDPMLSWVLYSEPGIARLVQVDAATGTATTARTWSFSTHWLPVGIAGSKLLWQRSDTGQLSLWTIDATGGYAGHQYITPPAGYTARGITLDQEGQCPVADAEDRTYTILFQRYGASPWFTPAPELWHLDANGAVTSTESLPTTYPWTYLRDFRYTTHGYAALVYRSIFALQGNGDGTAIDWYGRDGNGDLERLRTDTYSATEGNVGCTAHQPGVQCFFDTNDEVPGAGHELTSMVTTRTAGGNNPAASYLLWTRSDGTAKSYRLGLYGAQLFAPDAPIVTPHVGTSAVSLTGDAPEFCPIPQDPEPPSEFPSDPVIESPGCPKC